MYKISVDTGGTFTDVVVADETGRLTIGKALTTPERSFSGLIAAVSHAAEQLGVDLDELIACTQVLIYGTTRATNAIIETKTAKTALLVTQGFPDILVYRNGGKLDANKLRMEFPPPYIPRRLVFQIPERINAEGGVEIPIDQGAVRRIALKLKQLAIEAVAVCLLWSIANPRHEYAVADVLETDLPGVPYTLSSDLNPIIREYPRASSTAIDASLKPLIQRHLTDLKRDLLSVGFNGELLVSTSSGGVMHIDDMVRKPIYLTKSGPAMAPLAGIACARAEGLELDLIILDAGGTTFDVSLVRGGTIKYTRDTWLGPPLISTLLGIATVDVRSVGAGGGSIAWVDAGGLLRVGPKSAGSVPGPACYGRGGTDATVTDAAVALDYINPQRFLGGRMKLDRGAALTALQRLAEILGASTDETANAILEISSEAMIRAIQDITINDGIDPAESVVVAGGGAAGLNVLTISASLGCRKVIIPRSAGVLSATGGHFSDIAIDFSGACFTSTAALDGRRVAAMLGGLRQRASDFEDSLRTKGIANFRRELFVEARYHGQQAEFEIRVPDEWAEKPEDPRVLKRSFDAQYLRRYGTSRSDVEIETINWRMRTSALVLQPLVPEPRAGLPAIERHVHAYFGGSDRIRTRVLDGRGIEFGDRITGPAIIEETTTTIVVAPGMKGYLSKQGNYIFEIATSHD